MPKISGLPAASALTGTEVIPVVQSGSTVAATAADIGALAGAVSISAVRYDTAAQGLSSTQQQNAQANLGFGGTVVLAPSTAGSGDHLLIRNKNSNSATRAHVEPNGYVDSGTITKTDWMFDPYDSDSTNYRIVNIYTKNGNGNGLSGENGAAVLGLKAVGDQFGVWPSLHVGFSDDGQTGVPMKIYYFDTSDTAWRTPMTGAWRTGKSYTSGDYALAGNKLYQASSTGTSGATKPSHAAGTVSDGAVDWLFVRDYGAVTNSIRPVVLIGDRDDMPKFGLSGLRMQASKDIGIWNGVNLAFLNNSNAVGYNVYAQAGTADLYVKSTASGAGFFRFGSTGKYVQMSGLAHYCSQSSKTDNATTVDVTAAELITFGYTAPTTVTAFSGGPYQRFYVNTGNGNTTLQHSASIQLKGGVNKTLATGEVLAFMMNGAGTAATQIVS